MSFCNFIWHVENYDDLNHGDDVDRDDNSDPGDGNDEVPDDNEPITLYVHLLLT